MDSNSGEINEKIGASGLQPPETVTIMITDHCNLECTHCLLECGTEKKKHIVPKNILKNLIKEFYITGGKKILLTGGEPLTHPDYHEILEFARGLDFKEICVQTNAVLINDKNICKMKSLPLDRLVIQVSLDGACPESNDFVRGKGSFKAVLNSLQRMVESGLAGNVRIAFTEMKHNYDELPHMLNLVKRLGLRELLSSTLVKAGRSVMNSELSLPSALQVQNLLKKYLNDSPFRKMYEEKGNISAIEWFKGRNDETGSVCTCIKSMFIDSSGRIYPCVMNIDNHIAVYNVHEKGIRQCIRDGLDKWSFLPKLNRKRSESLIKCMGCSGQSHCRGGCMGRASVVNGDPMTVEDRCEMRRAVYYME